jgi:hypothetical protein
MTTTLLGSCRIETLKDSNNLNVAINYPHSTKEVLQLIKFITGTLSFPPPLDILCFRTSIDTRTPMVYRPEFTKIFDESTTCIVEICSKKTYMYDGYYLHNRAVDKRFGDYERAPQIVLDNYMCLKQSKDEIEADILEIKKLIGHRKMIVVTHYNSRVNGEYLESRNDLIKTLTETCEKHNIQLVNPEKVLKDYEQKYIMMGDLSHYSALGATKITEYINALF